ncbi:MAG: hypothetical protein IK012_07865 [Fibrobacter sp.]|uniref:hypothetical protein n=1 Tax=Fibrobacter sp. TaxID=35828 RepID=UPI0025B91484|nr:hypothetical protein [Fibrobacter sp.]MBR4785154.1 hypothetical protein [Fibrobacter sp.]
MLKKIFTKVAIVSALAILGACSGADGVDGVDGKDAAEVNVDSLADVLREEITGTLWDSLYAKPYVDTVYKVLFNNAFADAWMDSVRDALLDSLKLADYDSLYEKLYDSVYTDIYSRDVIHTLAGWIASIKPNINGAFANLYPLMYREFAGEEGNGSGIPIGVGLRQTCDRTVSTSCRWKKVMVKSWIEGFTDTATVTGSLNPDATITLTPVFKFNNDALLAITTPTKASIQVEAYALENDHEILFYSATEQVTINPMQINGGEVDGVKNREWYSAVWVTPNMDSIPQILDEVAALLPGNTLKVYQQYPEDETMMQSSSRVVKAVFEVLQKRKIHYIENNGAGSIGQKVNYPIEVLRSKQAICNEFSYLVASVLEAIGFQVYIVITTNHMFIGWAGEKGSTALGFLETTMLAHENATFEDAYESASNEFVKQQEEGNFENGSSIVFFLQAAREYGITPNNIP